MLVRVLALFAMVCIVGLTANFVAEIVSTNVDPPREIVGTLTIVRTSYNGFGISHANIRRRHA